MTTVAESGAIICIMRGSVWSIVLAAGAALVPADAAAEGTAKNGQPWPTQVAGWRFGSTKAQAADVCTKGGGKTTGAAQTSLSDAIFCSKLPEAIPAFPPNAESIRADFCGTALCEIRIFWSGVMASTAKSLVDAISAKYGYSSPADGSTPLSMLDDACRRDPSSDKRHDVAWVFGEQTKEQNTFVLAGGLGVSAACNADGGLTVRVLYRNKAAMGESARRSTANF